MKTRELRRIVLLEAGIEAEMDQRVVMVLLLRDLVAEARLDKRFYEADLAAADELLAQMAADICRAYGSAKFQLQLAKLDLLADGARKVSDSRLIELLGDLLTETQNAMSSFSALGVAPAGAVEIAHG